MDNAKVSTEVDGKCTRCGSGSSLVERKGVLHCYRCEDKARKERRNRQRRERDQAMRDLGMTKVRGALGGTYWE